MNSYSIKANTNQKEVIFMYNFRTDLALERRDIFKKANNIEGNIPGIESTKKQV